MGAWEDYFRIAERRSSVGREVVGGVTTFVTAVYLTIVIPNLLALGGMSKAAATTGVVVMFVVGTVAMGLYARLPLVVGPGIGGSALVSTVLAASAGVPWQTGLGIAFWSGLAFFLLTLLGMRALIVGIVPATVKMSLSAAIGVFIASLGLRNAGLLTVGANSHVAWESRIAGVVAAVAGLVVAVVLHRRGIPGALLLAITLATLIGIPLGLTKLPPVWLSPPHSMGPVAFQVDIWDALRAEYFPYMFAFFAAEFFSTMGTTLAIGAEAGWLDESGNMPGINGPFLVDSFSATMGPFLGIPASTALIESAAGVEAGARTGLASIVTAGCFVLTLLFSPLILMVPKEATAPALIFVGVKMVTNLRKVNLQTVMDGVPAVLTVLITLLANNFGTGIAAGILSYVLLKVISGKAREVPVGLYLLSLPLLYFFWIVIARH